MVTMTTGHTPTSTLKPALGPPGPSTPANLSPPPIAPDSIRSTNPDPPQKSTNQDCTRFRNPAEALQENSESCLYPSTVPGFIPCKILKVSLSRNPGGVLAGSLMSGHPKIARVFIPFKKRGKGLLGFRKRFRLLGWRQRENNHRIECVAVVYVSHGFVISSVSVVRTVVWILLLLFEGIWALVKRNLIQFSQGTKEKSSCFLDLFE